MYNYHPSVSLLFTLFFPFGHPILVYELKIGRRDFTRGLPMTDCGGVGYIVKGRLADGVTHTTYPRGVLGLLGKTHNVL